MQRIIIKLFVEDADPSVPEEIPFRPCRPVGIDFSHLTHGSMKKAMDFFMLFFTTAVLAKICEYTNAFWFVTSLKNHLTVMHMEHGSM
ncbi:piggyBac transposable element-derived protein 4-like [Acipenser oxyrinchus oxyrinchus]|uniref:PiggyBac transposable element-derived protein 4-like n=1 Tax=Acipenser oxyrinchus oxyrinchus TaxID=40147 RepID=A0AAD8DH69_ACIOX|nr:piggyBac transposable element-derived protein 4-like [Acipenser oxyrinchus oxyrinchus]